RPIQSDSGASWEHGTSVTSVDLANPTAPAVRHTLWLSGYTGTISATEKFLFVVTGARSGSEIHIIDISSPSGEIEPKAAVLASGVVADKFKINLNGDVLSVISSRQDFSTPWVSVLENFSLADSLAPAKLGEVTVGEREQLLATRFDGSRV